MAVVSILGFTNSNVSNGRHAEFSISKGYHAFSKWMGSDKDFLVVRSFDTTGARVLLSLQDRVTYLEEELKKEDKLCQEAPDEDAESGSFRRDPRPNRSHIMDSLSCALGHYRMILVCPAKGDMGVADKSTESFLISHMQLKAFPNATDLQRMNLKAWVSNSNGAIHDEEIGFINEKDLIAPASIKKTPFRDLLDRFEIARRFSYFKKEKVLPIQFFNTCKMCSMLTCPRTCSIPQTLNSPRQYTKTSRRSRDLRHT